MASFPENQGISISTCPNISHQTQTYSHLSVPTRDCMTPFLGSYPSSYINTQGCDMDNECVSLFGRTIFLNKLLTSIKISIFPSSIDHLITPISWWYFLVSSYTMSSVTSNSVLDLVEYGLCLYSWFHRTILSTPIESLMLSINIFK